MMVPLFPVDALVADASTIGENLWTADSNTMEHGLLSAGLLSDWRI